MKNTTKSATSTGAKVIAVFNQAGGAGKTSLTHNLGYHLAKKHKTLLVDIDPQSTLTEFMGVNSWQLEETISSSLLDKEPLPIHKGFYKTQLDLVPANIRLSRTEIQLMPITAREFRLRSAIETVLSDYRFVLIDCPPSLGILSINGLVAATHVLVPVQTEFKCFLGTEHLLNTINEVKDDRVNPHLKIAAFVPTLYDKQRSHHSDILQSLNNELQEFAPVLDPIPKTTLFTDASVARQPIMVFDSNIKSSVGKRAVKALNNIVNCLEKQDA